MHTQNCSTRLFALSAMLALVTACGTLRSQPDARANPAIDTLVTAEWLSQHLSDPDLVVLDCTVRVEPGKDRSFKILSGRADYANGHIATAGFADLTGNLSAAGGSGSFALPTPDEFAASMGALGIGDDSRVVLYSGNNVGWAARVWWMLRWIGFDRAAVLDGGLKAWIAEGRPLSTEPAARPARRLSVSLRPKLIADRDEVRTAIANHAITIIDALPEASFSGRCPCTPGPATSPAPRTSLPRRSRTNRATIYRTTSWSRCMPAIAPAGSSPIAVAGFPRHPMRSS
jgi:thiosulfate/3-mercaptopyruvate sulfurtransferase